MVKKVPYERVDMLRLAVAIYGDAKCWMGSIIRPIRGDKMTFGRDGWHHAKFDAVLVPKDHVTLYQWLTEGGATITTTAEGNQWGLQVQRGVTVTLMIGGYTFVRSSAPGDTSMTLPLFLATVDYLNEYEKNRS